MRLKSLVSGINRGTGVIDPRGHRVPTPEKCPPRREPFVRASVPKGMAISNGPSRPRTTPGGFSLVELLVVLGVIGLLIALLLPAMARARRAAASVACQSNLRQIFSAALASASEHRGYVQLAGSVNDLPDTLPATLDDPGERRYLYFEDAGARRPAPIQAALAPYLGNRSVRVDSAHHLIEDLSHGVTRRIFTCPAQADVPDGITIGKLGANAWTGPRLPISYGFNEGLLGFEARPYRQRGKLAKARPADRTLFAADALPRTELARDYVMWFPTPSGRCSLADAYTNADGSYAAGVHTQFDPFRHPAFRMNVAFCDGHVESVPLTARDLDQVLLMGP